MTPDQIAAERSLLRHDEQVRPDLAAVRVKGIELEQQARKLIRERPVAAVMVAAGAGYLLGRSLSSRLTLVLLGAATRMGMAIAARELGAHALRRVAAAQNASS